MRGRIRAIVAAAEWGAEIQGRYNLGNTARTIVIAGRRSANNWTYFMSGCAELAQEEMS